MHIILSKEKIFERVRLDFDLKFHLTCKNHYIIYVLTGITFKTPCQIALKADVSGGKPGDGGNGAGAGNPGGGGTGKDTEKDSNQEPAQQVDLSNECPVDREQLGRNTWAFLHTMAAYIPEQPTRTERKELEQFMGTLSKFYPCDMCATELRKT